MVHVADKSPPVDHGHTRRRTKDPDAFSGEAWPGRAFLFGQKLELTKQIKHLVDIRVFES